ncbi:conjugal transfer protein TraB [Spirochaetia bacterium]|nr:conjugal transfer protein TraB [Spirochaetia bacterium]
MDSITAGNREFILIGTAHVSRESIEEVKHVIEEYRPGIVCVELDEGRYSSMTQQEDWEKLNIVKVFREGKGFLLAANLILSGFQRRMGAELGVKPGEEMKIAIETAKSLNIPYSLSDREIQITLRRAWGRCGFLSKCKLLSSLISSAFTNEKLSEAEIESLKNRNELDGMMSGLADYLPQVKETLIDERDHYLAAKIWTAAQDLPPNTGNFTVENGVSRVVAVIGAGHLEGIKSWLAKMAAAEQNAVAEASSLGVGSLEPGSLIDVSPLNQIPPPSAAGKIVGWIIPALIAGLLVFGFFQSGAGVTLSMLLHWVLWNGSLAALGSLIALAHPLSILVSFIGAPIATLNPFIGVGLFSGVVQAVMYKPRVIDTEKLSEDISSLRGIYHNRITRALLVFFLSSIGGAIGNFISIPSLLSVLVQTAG